MTSRYLLHRLRGRPCDDGRHRWPCRHCEVCNAKLPRWSNSNRATCGSTCRKRLERNRAEITAAVEAAWEPS